MAKVEEQKFHFAIGKPWKGDEPNGAVGFYTYGSEIFYCTLNEAIEMRDNFNRKAKDSFFPDDASRGGYRIYQLTEVPNSEHILPTVMPEKKRTRTKKPAVKLKDAEDKLVDTITTMFANKKKLPVKTKKT